MGLGIHAQATLRKENGQVVMANAGGFVSQAVVDKHMQ